MATYAGLLAACLFAAMLAGCAAPARPYGVGRRPACRHMPPLSGLPCEMWDAPSAIEQMSYAETLWLERSNVAAAKRADYVRRTWAPQKKR